MAEKKEPFAGVLDESTAAWARGKSIDDLTLIDDDGEVLVAEKLARFDTLKKRLVDVPIFARFPTTTDHVKARAKTLGYLAKELGRDAGTLDAEAAHKLVGEARFEHVERLHLFERTLRRSENPKMQYMLAEPLDRSHPWQALLELDERLTEAAKMMEQRLPEDALDEPISFWAVVHAIGRMKNLSPLVAIGARGERSFIISMASLLSDWETTRSSAPSSESST